MGASEVVYYHDHLLVKEPGTQERTPWHHDQPYYPIDGEQIVSLWLPLDPVDRATCVEYVKGSHRWGRWFQPKFFKQGGVDLQVQDPRFEPLPDLDAERAVHEFLAWDMAPGDVIAFHALTLHGASGNLSSSRRRRAWATRWCGDDARYADPRRPDLAAARGPRPAARRPAGMRDVSEGARLAGATAWATCASSH